MEAGAKDAKAMAEADRKVQDAQLIQQKEMNKLMPAAITGIGKLADKALSAANALNSLSGGNASNFETSMTGATMAQRAGFGTTPEQQKAFEGMASSRAAHKADIAEQGRAQIWHFAKKVVGMGSGTLSGKTEGLHQKLVEALTSASMELGKPIHIRSGLRTPEEQQKMYNEWVEAGGGPGSPTVMTPSFGRVTTPAPPGKSRHQNGIAADIDQTVADELEKSGILAKYGLSRPVAGDPVHVQLEKFEFGGTLGAGRMGIAGEAGAELISGPADITPMNSLMGELTSLNEVSVAMLGALKDIARKQGEVADTSKKMLQVAQN